MPLRIDLQVEGPDREVFVVQGLRDIGREILLAVQRLDDQRYLTPHGLWDSAPSWHPCTRVGGDSGEGTVWLAAARSLAAGIRAAVGVTLQAHLRRGDFSDLGPLVVRDHGAAGESEIYSASVLGLPSEPLVPPPDLAATHPPSQDPAPTHASNGDSDRSESPEPGQPAVPLHAAAIVGSEASDLTWSTAATRETTWHLEPAFRSASVDPQAARPRAGTSRWLALSIVVLMVLAALGLGIRALVWRSAPDREPAQPAHSPAPPSTPATHVPEPPSAPIPKPSQPPEAIQSVQHPKPPDRTSTGVSGTSGKALYLELKGQSLSPQDLFDRGAQADRAGDCEAAIRLLIDAAKRAPGLAERLARRYDPEGFEPTPCFPQAKPDSAIVWYQSAAEQDVPAAQRRYGELLLGEAASGPIYQDAVDWLRKAASAGDEGATRRLEALGER